MTATIITIGDELLYGQTIDTNSAWLGQQLNQIGIRIHETIAVGDIQEDILSALKRANQNSKFVIVTGGLGPTKDDITKATFAQFMNVELIFSQETYDHILSYFAQRNRKPTQAHHHQSFMPSNAILLTNGVGTAPGMWMEYQDSYFLSMPGVPSEMKQIMLDEGLQKIQNLSTQEFIRHAFIRTLGVGETIISQKIEPIVDEFPPELSLAYLPGIASVKLRITARGIDEGYLIQQLEKYTMRIANPIEDWIYSYEDEEIQITLGKLCKEKRLKIGTAESCTGGAIASKITSVPGSSAYFEGAIISYSNDVKERSLQVKPKTLRDHGAVSEATVVEMVQGTIKALHVDVVVAVSGIAGPSGGTPDKPVGMVWLAVGNAHKIKTKKLHLTKNRKRNIEATALLALDEMRKFILA